MLDVFPVVLYFILPSIQYTTDTEAPIFGICPNDINRYAQPSFTEAHVTWIEPSVSDNADPQVTLEATSRPGSVFPLGTTLVNYTATDESGNVGLCSFTVFVKGTFFTLYNAV